MIHTHTFCSSVDWRRRRIQPVYDELAPPQIDDWLPLSMGANEYRLLEYRLQCSHLMISINHLLAWGAKKSNERSFVTPQTNMFHQKIARTKKQKIPGTKQKMPYKYPPPHGMFKANARSHLHGYIQHRWTPRAANHQALTPPSFILPAEPRQSQAMPSQPKQRQAKPRHTCQAQTQLKLTHKPSHTHTDKKRASSASTSLLLLNKTNNN